MGWLSKTEPSRAAFAVGKYKIDNPIVTTGLTEFSETEYEVMVRRFKRERNFHGSPVEFDGYLWNSMLGTVDRRIYKIALFLEFDTKHEANPVAMSALQYCTQQLGKPSSQETGLFTWDTTDGNVILQTTETAEALAVNLFITSKAVRNFEQLQAAS